MVWMYSDCVELYMTIYIANPNPCVFVMMLAKQKQLPMNFLVFLCVIFFAALSVEMANNALCVFVAKLETLHEIKVKEVMD